MKASVKKAIKQALEHEFKLEILSPLQPQDRRAIIEQAADYKRIKKQRDQLLVAADYMYDLLMQVQILRGATAIQALLKEVKKDTPNDIDKEM